MDFTFPKATWEVALSGYTWYGVPKGGGGYHGLKGNDSILCWPPGESRTSRTIDLLELDSQLFREFSEIEPTFDGIKEFADTYGLLGIKIARKWPRHGYGKAVNYRYVDDEPLRLWQQQIREMQQVIMLWEAGQLDDLDLLRRHIRWAPDGLSVTLEPPTGSAGEEDATRRVLRRSIQLDPPGSGAGALGSIVPGDVVLPAALFVGEIVGQQIREQPKEAPSKEAPYLQPGVHPRFALRNDPGEESDTFRVCLRTWPETLHQALWLQAVAWITEGKPFKRCQGCQRWFTLPPKAPRTRVGYCSDACRVRAYRERQDRARQMATEGKSFDAIARELGSDVMAVRRWVTGLKAE
jgi:hypothetical protein